MCHPPAVAELMGHHFAMITIEHEAVFHAVRTPRTSPPLRRPPTWRRAGSSVVELPRPQLTKIEFSPQQQPAAPTKRHPLTHARETFKFKLDVSLRGALAILVACFAATRTIGPTSDESQWLFLPHWYTQTGAIVAIFAVFPSATSVGGALDRLWQINAGIALTVVYFTCTFVAFPPTFSNLVVVQSYYDAALDKDVPWYMSVRDVAIFVPLVGLFTFAMFLAPMKIFTKVFGSLYGYMVVLAMLNPMNSHLPSELKSETGEGTVFMLHQVLFMSFLASVGTLFGFAALLFPYPHFASAKALRILQSIPADIAELLELVLEAYCFRTCPVSELAFVRSKVARGLDKAAARLGKVQSLMAPSWWEHAVGFTWFTGFDYDKVSSILKLHNTLIEDLQAMKLALDEEQRSPTHLELIKSVKRNARALQMHINDCYESTMKLVIEEPNSLDESATAGLVDATEKWMSKYRRGVKSLLYDSSCSPTKVEGTVVTNLFACSLHSFAQHVYQFPNNYNKLITKSRASTRFSRARALVWANTCKFFKKSNFKRQQIIFAARTALAAMLGILVSIYSMNYSSRAAIVIALTAQSHIGSTLNKTISRLIGMVMGCVIPVVFQFYICTSFPDRSVGFGAIDIILNSLVVVGILVVSRYAYFSGFSFFSGRLASYSCVSVLIQNHGRGGLSCPPRVATNAGLISYAWFTEALVGIMILLVTELLIDPKSARSLLQQCAKDFATDVSVALRSMLTHLLAFQRPESNDYEKLDEDNMASMTTKVETTIPNGITKGRGLLDDATFEPSLWQPALPHAKYNSGIAVFSEMTHQLQFLLKLAKADDQPTLSVYSSHHCAGSAELQTCQYAWLAAQDNLVRAMHGTTACISHLLGGELLKMDVDESAVRMQLREAFRRVDTQRRLKIDLHELTLFLEHITTNRMNTTSESLRELAEEIMSYAHTENGTIRFGELMDVLENHAPRLHIRRSSPPRAHSSAATIDVDLDNDDSDTGVPLLQKDMLYVETLMINERVAIFEQTTWAMLSSCINHDKTHLESANAAAMVHVLVHLSCLSSAVAAVGKALGQLSTELVSS